MVFFNRKAAEDGYTFDSGAELVRYRQLKLMLAAGEITNLKVHPRWKLAPGVRFTGEKRAKPALEYTADFSYLGPSGDRKFWLVVEDVKPRGSRSSKAYRTAAYRIRRHLMLAVHGIEVVEIEISDQERKQFL